MLNWIFINKYCKNEYDQPPLVHPPLTHTSQSYWGVTPQVGVHLQTIGEKIGVFLHVFGAEGAAKIFLALFFCKFGGIS